ncbi:MAG TPA: hypothetical protein VHI52_19890, partial [Verrucomicrobiae bacterium]|nr:hypothetical protein [Verrucomicrobiae bacterium]
MLTPSPDAVGATRAPSGPDGARPNEDVQCRRRRILTIGAAVLASIALTLAAMMVPRVPSESDQDTRADESWSAVLGFAHSHQLQFGTELVFTYGPLGFLATPLVAENQPGLRLAADLLLSLATCTGIVLVARRLGPLWGSVQLSTAVLLLGNIYPRSDLLIEAGLLCWGLLALVETGLPAKIAIAVFVAISAFGALVKINLLVLVILSASWLGLDLLLRRRLPWAIAVVGGFGLAFLVGWVGLGQSLLHLWAFLRTALITADGYNQAMGYEGSLELRWRGVFAAVAALAVLLIRSANAFDDSATAVRLRRALLGAWSLTVVFLVWKHGFVRTDRYHAGFYFGFIPIFVLATGVWMRPRSVAGLWSQLIALLCCFVCLVTVQSMVLPGDLRFSLLEPVRSVTRNGARLLRASKYFGTTEAQLSARRQRHRLPHVQSTVGTSGVDLFGCDQISIFCNELNYRPRPVFQSYAAYNAPLMRLNEAFYLSPAAPPYVLFCLDAQDRKFPALEDARTLRTLLINYEPAGAEGPFVLLRSRGKAQPQ